MPTFSIRSLIAAGAIVAALSSQSAQSQAPLADALRYSLATASKNFPGSVDVMPASKLSYKPTPGNLTYAEHMLHIADFSEMMCGLITGAKPPSHVKIEPATAAKDAIAGRLKQSFAFCNDVLSKLDDSRLAETVPFFGTQITRARAIVIISDDWADHYAVTSTYLRLNGLLPPTAKQ